MSLASMLMVHNEVKTYLILQFVLWRSYFPRFLKFPCNLLLVLGTGYLTACFVLMVGPEGRAVGVEHIPELVASSIENIQKSAAAPLLKEGSLSVHVGGMYFSMFWLHLFGLKLVIPFVLLLKCLDVVLLTFSFAQTEDLVGQNLHHTMQFMSGRRLLKSRKHLLTS